MQLYCVLFIYFFRNSNKGIAKVQIVVQLPKNKNTDLQILLKLCFANFHEISKKYKAENSTSHIFINIYNHSDNTGVKKSLCIQLNLKMYKYYKIIFIKKNYYKKY